MTRGRRMRRNDYCCLPMRQAWQDWLGSLNRRHQRTRGERPSNDRHRVRPKPPASRRLVRHERERPMRSVKCLRTQRHSLACSDKRGVGSRFGTPPIWSVAGNLADSRRGSSKSLDLERFTRWATKLGELPYLCESNSVHYCPYLEPEFPRAGRQVIRKYSGNSCRPAEILARRRARAANLRVAASPPPQVPSRKGNDAERS